MQARRSGYQTKREEREVARIFEVLVEARIRRAPQVDHTTSSLALPMHVGGTEDAMLARDLMTPNPVTIDPNATVAEASDIMHERDVRHVPVVERGALIGMVSDRDLGYLDIGRVLAVEGAAAARAELARPVSDRMSTDVIYVQPETEASDVIDLLLEAKIGAVPVVRPDTREIVGIVSYVDILRALGDAIDGT
jgi:acetoin utilization protein AcuB